MMCAFVLFPVEEKEGEEKRGDDCFGQPVVKGGGGKRRASERRERGTL